LKDKKKIAISIDLSMALGRYHKLYAGIQNYAKNTNWALVLDHYPESALRQCAEKPFYDGIIGRIKYSAYYEAQRFNVPMVNTWFQSDIEDISAVLIDSYTTGVLAAGHLLNRGLRNFALIDHNSKACDAFANGFRDTVDPYSAKIQNYTIGRTVSESIGSWESFCANFKSWCSDWQFPLGVAMSMDSYAPLVATRCLENGLSIPQDVVLIVGDNDESYCESIEPKISSIKIDYFRQGYEAAKMLDRMLQGEEVENERVYIKANKVISRESTDIFISDDSYVTKAIRYIVDNFQNDIQTADVVKITGLSRRPLEIRFLKAVGRSIHEEISRKRVELLKKNLLETGNNISDLVAQAGFNSPVSMRRAFEKETGMTPSEYRTVNRSPIL
jgi:LacI family transcriptional regulator